MTEKEMNKKFMFYSERAKLAKEYEEWVNKPLEDGSKIKDCPLSVITFMVTKGFYKLPEGSVVVSKERYSMFCELENKHIKDSEEFRQQACKETAKEIFEKVLSYIGSNQKFCIVDNDNQTLIDCDKLWEFVGILAKQYGVEE